MTSLEAGSVRRGAGLSLPCLVAFSATSFLSALLLFSIEPMFSKMVLPVLGGTSAVWSVAIVVFQGLLLGGYVYASLITTRLSLRAALFVHMGLLIAVTFSLPVAVSTLLGEPPGGDVALWLVALFLVSIGLPFFAVAANAPLLQAWFAGTAHKSAANPYFLYRASNLGSFAVLLSYPFLIEPAWGLAAQSRIWTAGYAFLALSISICGVLALLLRRTDAPRAAAKHAAVPWRSRFEWTAYGFVPSGLLVAVTAHISTDVASAPFLWVMPLALYLLSFVLAFTDRPLVPLAWWLKLQPFAIALLVGLLLLDLVLNWAASLLGHLAAFFVAAMICQMLLYRNRPETAALTQFYVWMSLGGVLGGIFAALAAPQMFDTVLEYPLLALAAFALRPGFVNGVRALGTKDVVFALALPAIAVAVFFALGAHADLAVQYYSVVAVLATLALPFLARNPVRFLVLATALATVTSLAPPGAHIVHRARSFFGVYKIVEANGYRLFMHGTTTHGAERIAMPPGRRPEPLAYYYRKGALGEAIEAIRARGGLRRAAVVGLGIGALSCYVRPSERWTFYELDPLVVRLAEDRRLFRSFDACARGAQVVPGDARLTLRDAKPGLDLLVLDAFTSDSIPVHLLTKEAFALYRSKLSPHGIIVFHISNRNLELARVVASSAAANGMVAALHPRHAADPHAPYEFPPEVAVVARNARDLAALRLGPEWHALEPGETPWTDDYSDILGALIARLGRR